MSADSVPHWSPPRVSSEVFLGHHWGVVVVSLGFIAFRIGVRIKCFKRIWADDYLIIGAWILLLATASIYQSQKINLYNHYPLLVGEIPATPENLAKEVSLLKAEVAEFYLFYTALWMVKLSVLLFFKRIFAERRLDQWLKTWWWFVTGFTVITWAACLGTIPYSCLLNPLPWIVAQCGYQAKIDYVWINLHLSCATDILTDVMILSIPVIGLWKVQISPRRKLALLGIFFLTVITIVFAIVRIAVEPNKHSSADITWLCLWAHVETGVAVIVSCFASFRQLFVSSERSSDLKPSSSGRSSWPRSSSSNWYLYPIKNPFSRRTNSQPSYPSTNGSSGGGSLLPNSLARRQTAESLPSHHSAECEVSKAGIHVNQDIDMDSIVFPDEMEKPKARVYSTVYPVTVRRNG